MDIKNLKSLGFNHEYKIKNGIEDTIDWYRNYKKKKNKMIRYNSFLEKL